MAKRYCPIFATGVSRPCGSSALMRLDAPGDGITHDFELWVRALEPIGRLGLGGGLVERGNRVALHLDTALLVGDGIGLFHWWASHGTRPPCLPLDSCGRAPYPVAAAAILAGCTSAVKSSISLRVMSPMANLYSPISETGVTSAAGPVMKHSENSESSSGMIARSITFRPRCLASPMTVRLVMPSRKQSGSGVCSTPSLTKKMLAPVASATCPRQP